MTSKIYITSDLERKARLRLEAEELRESFPEFAARAWREVDSSKFIPTKFHDLLLQELHDWGVGDDASKRKVMLGVPPREGKTKFANIILPAWMWARDPGQGILGYGSTEDLVNESNRLMRQLIMSDWYQERFCLEWNIDKSQYQKRQFANTKGGQRKAIGGKGSPTGWGGNIIIVDDPIDLNPNKPPPRPEDLERATAAVKYLLNTRVNNPLELRALIIMQRSHENDPIGQLLKDEGHDWHKVFFDAICDPRMPHRHPKDARTKGEVLCPERGQTIESLGKKKVALGSDRFNAQYQQSPAVEGGMIIKPSWFQRWQSESDWEDCPWTIVSWDCAFKGEDTSSWVVGSVWKVDAPDDQNQRRFYLVDLVRDHLDYAETKRAIERLSLRWPESDFTVIEDKANGPALVSELKYKIPNVIAFNPNPYGGKEQRLRSVSPVFEQGRVWVPADGVVDWTDEYVDELTRFPKSAHNDQVDSTAQVMLGSAYHLKEWIEKARGKTVRIFTMG